MAKATTSSKKEQPSMEEKEELFNDINKSNPSPLTDRPTVERTYAQGPKVDPNNIPNYIPEPSFIQPDFTEIPFDDPLAGKTKDTPKQEAKSEPENKMYFDPQFEEMPDADKEESVKIMADTILSGYVQIKKGCSHFVKFNEDKLEREFSEGTIDPHLQLNTGDGTITVREYALEFNESVTQAFETSPETIEKIRTPLEAILRKKGIGLSHEKQLILAVGTDLVQTGIMGFSLMKTNKSMHEMMREQTIYLRENRTAKKQPEKPQFTQEEEEIILNNYQKEFSEPEDTNYDDLDADVSEAGKSKNLPKFGDKAALDHMKKAEKK